MANGPPYLKYRNTKTESYHPVIDGILSRQDIAYQFTAQDIYERMVTFNTAACEK
jgi:hypothetical protein